MYTHYVKEFLMEFDDEFYKTNMIKIHVVNSKIEERSIPFRVIVTDGITTVTPIMQDVSGNRKTIAAFFTTDAFSVFTGNVDIKFGYPPNYEVFAGVDINAVIGPLDAISATVSHLIADNAWLASL